MSTEMFSPPARSNTAEKNTNGNARAPAEEFEDSADILFLGIGSLHRWSWPEIEGLKQFGGPTLHSARFSESEWQDVAKDWGNKAVGVIGNVCILDLRST